MKARSSRLGLVVWLIVGAALGLVATQAIRAPRGGAGTTAGSGALLAVDPANVASITVRDADGREVVTRRDGRGGWEVVSASRESGAWPAEADPALTALEALAELQGMPSRGAKGEQRRDEALVTVTTLDGASRSVLIGTRARGGAVTARTKEGRAGTAAAPLAEALIDPGMRAWRSRVVMPGAGMEATRVRIAHAGAAPGATSEFRLEKRGARWWLAAPTPTRADETAVNTLLAALAEARVNDFGDAPGAPGGTAAPTGRAPFTVSVETDTRVRSEGGEARTETRATTLTLTALEGDTETAIATTPDGAGRMTISAPRLLGLALAPDAFASRSAAGALAPDVGGLVIAPVGGSPRSYRRTLDGWVETRSAGTTASAEGDGAGGAGERAGAIDAAVAFLCGAQATEVQRAGAPGADEFHPLAVVTLLGFKANVLEMVTVGEAGSRLATIEGVPGAGIVRVFGQAEGALRGAFTPALSAAR